MSNIRTIAERSNVSIATVSRVLNNHENVSADTRLLVLQAAQALGYPLPETARRSMVFRSVLVLMRPDSESSASSNPGYGAFESAVWRGVEAVLTAKGVAVKLQQAPMTVADADRIASEAGVAGLILLGGVVANQFLERLQQLGLPFVAVGSHAHPLHTNYVMADVTNGIRQAVDHLVAGGRTRIGFVNGPPTTGTSSAKMDGFRLALAIHDLPYTARAVVAAEFTPDSGCEQTVQLLSRYPELDAIVYGDDRMAIGGLKAMRDAGRRVPQDVAVIGFGHLDIARYVTPSLTTVGFDLQAMGKKAARRLYDLLEDPDDCPWGIIEPTALIVGESA
ncbi:MAG: LacI family DNA-binding transcriptional regulator [Caldilineaceae bacterium]|nr:LacI family DNA-binding transcriptional regulator [Caldilineaceae bacterium]